MSVQVCMRLVGLLLVLVSFTCLVNAQEVGKSEKPDVQPAEASRLDDAAAIARLLFNRYRDSPANTTEVSGDKAVLEGPSTLSADNRRRIERNAFQAFVWRNFSYSRPSAVYLRCAGRQGEIFLVTFDRAGKMISCETDRNPSAGHYVTHHYVTLFYVADNLREYRIPGESDGLMRLEVAFDNSAMLGRGAPPFADRNVKREWNFVLTRKNGTTWCRGHFTDDLPTGDWQLYDSDGKATESWTFPFGKVKKIPNAPVQPFTYEGDLDANDFALTLVQGSPGPASGPPRTTIRVSAGGNCETEFGKWKASFRLTNQMQRTLRDLVRVIDVPSLKETYTDPHIHDGGWMHVSLRTNGVGKTVHFVNMYPRPVRDLADFFAADVLPQYPIEFLGAFKGNFESIRGSRTYLDDEK